uniref:Putative secreted peptide n=1 Tax=Anopheles braziliensis TaxID=58242 RepID=A0A2M3ZSX1_9DIPT
MLDIFVLEIVHVAPGVVIFGILLFALFSFSNGYQIAHVLDHELTFAERTCRYYATPFPFKMLDLQTLFSAFPNG